MLRMATCAEMITPSATIHVTNIEFVTGKPNGRPISTALAGNSCSAGAAASVGTATSGAGVSAAHASIGAPTRNTQIKIALTNCIVLQKTVRGDAKRLGLERNFHRKRRDT